MSFETEFETQPRPSHTTRVLVAVGILLGAGALIWMATRSNAGPPRLDVTLIDLDADQPGDVGSGPGGFVRIGENMVEFSRDGEEWREISLPGASQDSTIANTRRLNIDATDNLWMIHRIQNDRTVTWTSKDGAAWTRHRLDEDWAPTIRRVDGTGGAFLAQTRDPVQYYWSQDGRTWTLSQPPLEVIPGTQLLANISKSGVTLRRHTPASTNVELFHTLDGTSWTTGSIDYSDAGPAGQVGIHTIERIADKWVAIGSAVDGVTRPRQVDVVVWTSADGVIWEFLNSPELYEQGFLAAPISLGDAIVVPVIEGPIISRWWATTDGAVWDDVGFPIDTDETSVSRDNRLDNVAGRDNGDGTYTLVYNGR